MTGRGYYYRVAGFAPEVFPGAHYYQPAVWINEADRGFFPGDQFSNRVWRPCLPAAVSLVTLSESFKCCS